jgi:hypothetical protein
LRACVLAGFHVDCNKEVLAEDCLAMEAESRETVRGAERANDLRENMVKDVMILEEIGMVVDLFVGDYDVLQECFGAPGLFL